MARVTIEDCLEKVENRFVLVHAAAARSRELLEGNEPQVAPGRNKPSTVALREIAQGFISVQDAHVAKPAKKSGGRGRRGGRNRARGGAQSS